MRKLRPKPERHNKMRKGLRDMINYCPYCGKQDFERLDEIGEDDSLPGVERIHCNNCDTDFMAEELY